MFNGEKDRPDSNVPATAQAYVAPKSAPVVPNAIGRPKFGGTDICPRCHKAVYMAEKMMGAGFAWHKSCFNCNECHKRIESTNLCERDDEIYCKSKLYNLIVEISFNYFLNSFSLLC